MPIFNISGHNKLKRSGAAFFAVPLALVLFGFSSAETGVQEVGRPIGATAFVGSSILESNRTEESVTLKALRNAAENDNARALWTLARLYSIGQGVEQNHSIAFKMYRRLIEIYGGVDLLDDDAPFVGDAFLQLGHYYRDGTYTSSEQPSPQRAWTMYYTAGHLHRKASAFYALYEMCEIGVDFGTCSPVQKIKWLGMSARKGYAKAQAQLGKRMFDGFDVKQDRVTGLMWLTVAATKKGDVDPWISETLEQIRSNATPEEIANAQVQAVQWQQQH